MVEIGLCMSGFERLASNMAELISNCYAAYPLIDSRLTIRLEVNMNRLLVSVLVFAGIVQSAFAQSDPFAPAQPLADGWEKMDERLIFLMVRLVDVEANLEAVDLAIAKNAARAGTARSTASRAEAGNDRMDRRAGGPVRWDQFYGRTAEKFFYHPTDNHTYHTRTILSQQSPSNDSQGQSGVPSRQGVPVHQRPPQFDYMYRANENAKQRATAEVAKIANKVDALAARRAELELEQSKLWCEVAFRVVSRNDLDKKPLYRFKPKGTGQESLTAAASFVVVALSIVKSGESDQASAFRQIKPMVSKARSDLGDTWLQLGVNYQNQSTDEWKFATLARHLEDVSSNLSDSYSVSLDSARNSDADRRDMFRGLLQKSLVQYAETVLALNEMASEMADTLGFEPELNMPIGLVKMRGGESAREDVNHITIPPSELSNSLGMKLQLIPAGEFMMGSKLSPEQTHKRFPGGEASFSSYEDEHPRHRVRLTKAFYLGAQEVTVGQFRRFVSLTGYRTTAEREGTAWGYREGKWSNFAGLTWQSPDFDQTDSHPVTCVSWEDAVAFCEWLSQSEGRQYRLPTEAEWEYACRAGTDTAFFWGDEPSNGKGYLNGADSSGKPDGGFWGNPFRFHDGHVRTSPVGSYRSNGYGLYDMHGNVNEWCSDYYSSDYYSKSPVNDPTGPSGESTFRVNRGGCWVYNAGGCRSASRGCYAPSFRSIDLGFRVALVPSD